MLKPLPPFPLLQPHRGLRIHTARCLPSTTVGSISFQHSCNPPQPLTSAMALRLGTGAAAAGQRVLSRAPCAAARPLAAHTSCSRLLAPSCCPLLARHHMHHTAERHTLQATSSDLCGTAAPPSVFQPLASSSSHTPAAPALRPAPPLRAAQASPSSSSADEAAAAAQPAPGTSDTGGSAWWQGLGRRMFSAVAVGAIVLATVRRCRCRGGHFSAGQPCVRSKPTCAATCAAACAHAQRGGGACIVHACGCDPPPHPPTHPRPRST